MAKEQLGTLACLCCNREIPVKKSAGGALSACCPWCDLSAYAKEGTEAHRIIAGRMPRAEAAVETPVAEKPKKRREVPADPPDQVPAAQPAPAPKKTGSIWDDLYGKQPA